MMDRPLAVWWLGLSAFAAEGPGSVPGQGTKVPHGHGQKKKGEGDVPIILIPG